MPTAPMSRMAVRAVGLRGVARGLDGLPNPVGQGPTHGRILKPAPVTAKLPPGGPSRITSAGLSATTAINAVEGGAVTPRRVAGRAGHCVVGLPAGCRLTHRTGKSEEMVAATADADILEGDHSIPLATAAGVRRGGVPRQPRCMTRGRLA